LNPDIKVNLNPDSKGYEDMELPGENRRTGNVKYWSEAVKNELCKKHQTDVAAGLIPYVPAANEYPYWTTFPCSTRYDHKCKILYDGKKHEVAQLPVSKDGGQTILTNKETFFMADFEIIDGQHDVIVISKQHCDAKHGSFMLYSFNKQFKFYIPMGPTDIVPSNGKKMTLWHDFREELCQKHYSSQ
jgi:hypothetical protein